MITRSQTRLNTRGTRGVTGAIRPRNTRNNVVAHSTRSVTNFRRAGNIENNVEATAGSTRGAAGLPRGRNTGNNASSSSTRRTTGLQRGRISGNSAREMTGLRRGNNTGNDASASSTRRTTGLQRVRISGNSATARSARGTTGMRRGRISGNSATARIARGTTGVQRGRNTGNNAGARNTRGNMPNNMISNAPSTVSMPNYRRGINTMITMAANRGGTMVQIGPRRPAMMYPTNDLSIHHPILRRNFRQLSDREPYTPNHLHFVFNVIPIPQALRFGPADQARPHSPFEVNYGGTPPLPQNEIDNIFRINVNDEYARQRLRCSICFEDIVIGETVCRFPCEHIYHENCIVPWLHEHATCPNCRRPLNTEGDATEDADERPTTSNARN